MASEQSIWYRLGYALERARQPTPSAGKRLQGLAGRPPRKAAREEEALGGLPTDQLLSAGVALLAGKLLDAWGPRRRVRLSNLLRAAAAGAGAALVVDLLRPLLKGRPALGTLDRQTADRVLAGLGQGLVYGSVVEPRLPGPALLKGAVFGAAEYAAGAAGGLTHLVGAHTPHARLPVIGQLLEELGPHDRDYVEHLAFGIVVGLLYRSSPSSNGIAFEDAEDDD
jgi:hypothetical protein